MRQKPPKPVLSRVRKLAQIASDLSEGANFSINPADHPQVLVRRSRGCSPFCRASGELYSRRISEMSSPLHLSNSEWRMHNELLERAVERLGSYVEGPTDPKREELRNCCVSSRA